MASLHDAVGALNLPVTKILLEKGEKLSLISASGAPLLPESSFLHPLPHILTESIFQRCLKRVTRLLLSINVLVERGIHSSWAEIMSGEASQSNLPDHLRMLVSFSPSLQLALSLIDGRQNQVAFSLLRDVNEEIIDHFWDLFLGSDPTSTFKEVSRVGSDGQNSWHKIAHHDLKSSFTKISSFLRLSLKDDGDVGEGRGKEAYKGLKTQDRLGQTPRHIASRRYGLESTIYKALLELERELESLSNIEEVIKPLLDVMGRKAGEDPLQEAGRSTRRWGGGEETVGSMPSGWGGKRREFDTHPPGRCDFTTIHKGGEISRQEFLKLVVSGAPVLLKGAGNRFESMRLDFRKEDFVSKYGHIEIEKAVMPYGSAFLGPDSVKTSIEEYATQVVEQGANEKIVTEPPMYAASHGIKEMSLPEYSKAKELFRDLGTEATVTDFCLGAPGAGAQFHVNDIAINILVHGRKRWFVTPPGVGNYTFKPAWEWLQDDYVQGGTLECVQEAGDILYLPRDWPHQTLCVESSISLAHEFSSVGVDSPPRFDDINVGEPLIRSRPIQSQKKDL